MKDCCKTYLDEQFGGDPDIIAEIYNEYASSAREKIAEAAEALAASAWEPLDRIAHTVKGNALAAGDKDMADTAIALRSAAKLADAAEAARLVERLQTLQELL